MERNWSLFDRQYGKARMELNGLSCELHMPGALISRFDGAGNEIALGLPPGNHRPAFAVGEYDAACPANWMRGSANAASFFIPVQKDHGLWLNFNENQNHRHHVAAVVSIQGLNAVTGQKTDKLTLEQYRTNCPVHNEPFGENRFCKLCNGGKGLHWPHQNYLATTGTPHNYFWLDGFRAEDGVTRQFVFTDDIMKGVAARLIGDQRVFALGVAFFLSKEPKPEPVVREYRHTNGGPMAFAACASLCDVGDVEEIGIYHLQSEGSDDLLGSVDEVDETESFIEESVAELESAPVCRRVTGPTPAAMAPPSAKGFMPSAPAMRVNPKKFEIKAGARIDQDVYRDDCEPSFWQDEPAAIFYLNYIDEESAYAILAQGPAAMPTQREGFLESVPVGHSGPGSA